MLLDADLPVNNVVSETLPNPSNSAICDKDALTNSYGWFVQAMLATLAFALLILKRFCEPIKHRRSWTVWFYDTSKQGLGAMIVHFANVFMAGEFKGDPCTWYIVSFLLDSTVGLLIIWAGIRLSIYFGRRKGCPTILFGEYGRPPSVQAWGHQCLLYIAIMVVEKLFITLLMGFDFWDNVRDLILSPITSPQLRVVLVMLVIPFFINALIFWVTDNFLMLKVKRISEDDGNDNKSVGASHPKIRYKRHDHQRDDESDILLSSSSNDDELLGTTESLQDRRPTIRAIV